MTDCKLLSAEPVAWMYSYIGGTEVQTSMERWTGGDWKSYWEETPLYTAPQPTLDVDVLVDALIELADWYKEYTGLPPIAANAAIAMATGEKKMTTTFETAKVGDKVWSAENGWGEIYSIDEGGAYPIGVVWSNTRRATYTLEGRRLNSHEHQSLFWDVPEIKAPSKPLPDLEVDTKVLVWDDITPKTRRYFSHFSSSGEIMCFVNGMTSWTTKQTNKWDNWELADDNK